MITGKCTLVKIAAARPRLVLAVYVVCQGTSGALLTLTEFRAANAGSFRRLLALSKDDGSRPIQKLTDRE